MIFREIQEINSFTTEKRKQMITGDFLLIPPNSFYSSYYALGVIALEPDVSQIHSKIVFNL